MAAGNTVKPLNVLNDLFMKNIFTLILGEHGNLVLTFNNEVGEML